MRRVCRLPLLIISALYFFVRLFLSFSLIVPKPFVAFVITNQIHTSFDGLFVPLRHCAHGLLRNYVISILRIYNDVMTRSTRIQQYSDNIIIMEHQNNVLAPLVTNTQIIPRYRTIVFTFIVQVMPKFYILIRRLGARRSWSNHFCGVLVTFTRISRSPGSVGGRINHDSRVRLVGHRWNRGTNTSVFSDNFFSF